jgi:peroxiredoxin
MAASKSICDFGWKAVDFSLKGTDGEKHTLSDLTGPNGTLIMFICNHCPYVVGAIDRIVRDANDLKALGIGVGAIMSNDTAAYPADSFDNMKLFAARHSFTFPYLIDESQAVARVYDAVCTPDVFGFNKDLALQYRGRIDAGGRTAPGAGSTRELFDAMVGIAETGRGPEQQVASMGCSIKWRAGA